MSRLRNVYPGWWLVSILGLTELVSWGTQFYGFSLFINPMREEFGWSLTELTGAFSLGLLVAGLVGVPIGRVLDSHGPRVVMSAGSLLAGALFIAWSRIDSLVGFYVLWVFFGVSMAATFYEPAFVFVANWFRTGRSRALTILTFGGGFASVVFVPLINWLLSRYEWRETLVILGLLLLVLTLPLHALLLRRRPADIGLEVDGERVAAGDSLAESRPTGRRRESSISMKQAVRGSAFRWLSLAFFLMMLANVALLVHLIPLTTERGVSTRTAAALVGAIGLMSLPGRLIFTPLGGRIGRQYVAALIFSLQALSLVMLLTGTSSVHLWGFVVLFGAGMGAITPARAALVADFYGPAQYGAISGVLSLIITFARAAAPLGTSLAHDALGSYDTVLLLFFAISIGSAVAILMAGIRAPERPPEGRVATA